MVPQNVIAGETSRYSRLVRAGQPEAVCAVPVTKSSIYLAFTRTWGIWWTDPGRRLDPFPVGQLAESQAFAAANSTTGATDPGWLFRSQRRVRNRNPEQRKQQELLRDHH